MLEDAFVQRNRLREGAKTEMLQLIPYPEVGKEPLQVSSNLYLEREHTTTDDTIRDESDQLVKHVHEQALQKEKGS